MPVTIPATIQKLGSGALDTARSVLAPALAARVTSAAQLPPRAMTVLPNTWVQSGDYAHVKVHLDANPADTYEVGLARGASGTWLVVFAAPVAS